MDRAEQLTRELYFVHKSGEHSVAYAVARIMALEALLQKVMDSHHEGVIALEPSMVDEIDSLLVPTEVELGEDDTLNDQTQQGG